MFFAPFQENSTTLPNGLEVVFINTAHLQTVLLSVYVRIGSRFESADENGLSHMLEHMLFRGTKRYPNAFLLNQAVESIGGTLYAETRRDSSTYQLALPKENIFKGLTLLQEILLSPRFSDLEVERNIIREEIYEDFDAHGDDINLNDLAYNILFDSDPLGQKISGTIPLLESFGLPQLKKFFNQHYGAQNIVLCVAGNFSLTMVQPFVEKMFAELPARKKTKITPITRLFNGPQIQHKTLSHSPQTAISYYFFTKGELSAQFLNTLMLLRILDDGLSTRLYQRIVNELGLAYYVSAGIDSFSDISVISLEANAVHKNVAQLSEEILGILQQLKSKSVTMGELHKAKQRSYWDMMAICDDLGALSDWFGRTRLFMQPTSINARIEQINSISKRDILQTAQEVFTQDNMLLFTMGTRSNIHAQKSLQKAIEKF